MHYIVLTTGSCGNAYAFSDGENTLLVDDGVTYTKLTASLEKHGIPLSSVRALFLTHLHPDHSKGVGVLQRKAGIPVYLSDIAIERNRVVLDRQKIEVKRLTAFSFGDIVAVPGFSVTPFRTVHDSEGSAGYFITSSGLSVFIMTDTGSVPPDALGYALKADVEFIEANYDDELLENGKYTEALKRRIRGEYGHLSNRTAVNFAKDSARHGDHIYFVHLSANNNSPEHLRELVRKEIPSGIFCRVLERGEGLEDFLDGRE